MYPMTNLYVSVDRPNIHAPRMTSLIAFTPIGTVATYHWAEYFGAVAEADQPAETETRILD